MQNELIVEGNRKVSIKAIYQWPTYGGLLEGLPTERINDGILRRLPRDIQRHCGDNVFHIIPPTQTPIEYEGNYPFGTPLALPSIICIADLTHFQPVKDINRDGSKLIIAWFQNDYLFPIATEIIEKLKDFKWSEFASDFYY